MPFTHRTRLLCEILRYSPQSLPPIFAYSARFFNRWFCLNEFLRFVPLVVGWQATSACVLGHAASGNCADWRCPQLCPQMRTPLCTLVCAQMRCRADFAEYTFSALKIRQASHQSFTSGLSRIYVALTRGTLRDIQTATHEMGDARL